MLLGVRVGQRYWAHAQLRSVGASALQKDDAPTSHLRWVGYSGSPGADSRVPTKPVSVLVHPPLLSAEMLLQTPWP